MSGEKDHTVPWAIANSSFKKQRRNKEAVTEIVEMPGRGHSLTIDHGWRGSRADRARIHPAGPRRREPGAYLRTR